MFFKVSDDFQIRFEETPWNLGGTNALFIHGNLASTEWWLPTFKALQSKTATRTTAIPSKLLSLDWRGYGQSKGLNAVEEIDFEVYAEDCIELIESRGLNNVHLVGHSTGGMIAMLAALKKPELFKSMVLLDSVGAKGLELVLPKPQVLEHFDKMSKDRQYFEIVLAATVKNVDLASDEFKQILDITWNCDRVCWTGVIETLATKIDFEDRLRELKIPTLILHGSEDLVLPYAGSEKLNQQISGSHLKMIAGAGHSFNLENPSMFADELIRFWN